MCARSWRERFLWLRLGVREPRRGRNLKWERLDVRGTLGERASMWERPDVRERQLMWERDSWCERETWGERETWRERGKRETAGERAFKREGLDVKETWCEVRCVKETARPYESCKIFKGRPRWNAFSNLVHRQYKSFPPDRFCQAEIQKTTELSN